MKEVMAKKSPLCLFTLSITGITILSAFFLSSTKVSAEVEHVNASVIVPEACTMSGSGMNSHTATLSPGTFSGNTTDYSNGIGKTTFSVVCNDYNGFSIYAIGFTGDSYDSTNHTKLVGSNTGGTINTAVYANGNTTSSWSMRVNKVTDTSVSYNPSNMSIQNSFDNWHTIPDTYTKVAQYHASTGSSTTDTTLGAKVETTYSAFIATNQPADTYIGQVKYTMVHPYNETPLQPQTATSGCINYFPNGSNVVGTMGCQPISASDTTATLLAGNFSRTGYGFAGWSNKFDYATNPNQAGIKFYGPQEDITFAAGQYTGTNDGLALYAVWVPSAGNLQDSSKVSELCGTGVNALTTAPTDGTANLSSVSALTDQRDDQTYAIAKLADGNCWMIENLRLEAENTRTAEKQALAQGYSTSTTYGNFSGLADAESTGFTDTYSANSHYSNDGSNGTINIGGIDYPDYRMPRYNNLNTQSRASNPTSNAFDNSASMGGMYSYGSYYTWSAAKANTIYYSSPTGTDADGKTSETVNTSICPTGWKIPYGGSGTSNATATGSFYYLSYKINNDSVVTDSTASKKARAFPNNFIYSGRYSSSVSTVRGTSGYYWSSTAVNGKGGYFQYVWIQSSRFSTAAYLSGERYMGYSVRCIINS